MLPPFLYFTLKMEIETAEFKIANLATNRIVHAAQSFGLERPVNLGAACCHVCLLALGNSLK